MHIHIHPNHRNSHPHPHQGPFSRAARGLGSTLDRLTGPGMTARQRSDRTNAEARNERYGAGIL